MRLSLNLHRFSLLTALAALALIGLGGLVTSHGVGMAVPDWPNTYGYNMFFFPVSQWMGGIFYEHTHRLLASAVGLLTSVLVLWLYGSSARPFMRWTGLSLLLLAIITAIALHHPRSPRGQSAPSVAAPPPATQAQAPNSQAIVAVSSRGARSADGLVLGLAGLALLAASRVWPRSAPAPKWLRHLGLAAFLAVVLQGVLGGLRVVWCKDALGIFHATLAQLFFVLLCALALFTSPWWQQRAPQKSESGNKSGAQVGRTSGLGPLLLFATLLILVQLALGATMRHQHAGLAIPDFPLAYGKPWPPMDPASVALYNQHRLEITAVNAITATQISLQMVHRILALLIFVAVAACAWTTRRKLGGSNTLSRLTSLWLGLILVQVILGAVTIWSDKAADIATAHVVVGALSLALGAVLTLLAFRDLFFAHQPILPGPAEEFRVETPFVPRPTATAI